jgi:bacteriocin biosynthesis cyclodehydratase domain-containing protein
MLKPALRRLWRDPATLQLGVDPRGAVVLAGIDAGDVGLLELIDGTRDNDALGAEAQRLGGRPERMQELVEALEEAAVLDDGASVTRLADPRRQPDVMSLSLLHPAPGAAGRVMAARTDAMVEVLGAGRVGATVGMLLAAAGVGLVEPVDDGPVRPADFAPGGIRSVGSRQASRAQAARALLGAATPPPFGPAPGPRGARAGGGPDEPGAALRRDSAVVLAPTAAVVPPEWLAQVRQRPHLPVVIRETTSVIGPFVLPGRTPCLRCLELTRGDRDPAWPAMAAQLVGEPRGVEPCDIGLASAAASIVALHVLRWLDHGGQAPPPSVGGTLELSLADLRLRRRTVIAHPGCGCGAIDA